MEDRPGGASSGPQRGPRTHARGRDTHGDKSTVSKEENANGKSNRPCQIKVRFMS